jgi:hypothetical protein
VQVCQNSVLHTPKLGADAWTSVVPSGLILSALTGLFAGQARNAVCGMVRRTTSRIAKLE